jgi:spermidine synthase
MDAFGGVAVPWHLTTREVVADVRRVLKPDGLYLVNVIDYPPQAFAKAEARTLEAEFPHVAVIARPNALSGAEGGNFVLLASDQPIDAAAIRQRLAGRSTLVADAPAVRAFIGAGPVLTDDYAPVDQLLTPYPS